MKRATAEQVSLIQGRLVESIRTLAKLLPEIVEDPEVSYGQHASDLLMHLEDSFQDAASFSSAAALAEAKGDLK